MADLNVLFRRLTTSEENSEAIKKRKIIYEYEHKDIYVDVDDTTRVNITPRDSALSTTSENAISNKAITTSIVNDLATAIATTADYVPCGTKVVKALNTNMQWVDITSLCTWSSSLNSSIDVGGGILTNFAKVNLATRTIEIMAVFNSGRANASALVTLPSAYAQSSGKAVVVGRKMEANNLDINYIAIGSAINAYHSVSTSTSETEFCHFIFTY